jgi:hypothetical protein
VGRVVYLPIKIADQHSAANMTASGNNNVGYIPTMSFSVPGYEW